mmetsp:Transcript_37724/g.82886  ORF Transcript_37724/g.82886 Transcript_37724/m.82886 type:complete len:269 (+) Transcript_37724:2421-3227(+)
MCRGLSAIFYRTRSIFHSLSSLSLWARGPMLRTTLASRRTWSSPSECESAIRVQPQVRGIGCPTSSPQRPRVRQLTTGVRIPSSSWRTTSQLMLSTTLTISFINPSCESSARSCPMRSRSSSRERTRGCSTTAAPPRVPWPSSSRRVSSASGARQSSRRERYASIARVRVQTSCWTRSTSCRRRSASTTSCGRSASVARAVSFTPSSARTVTATSSTAAWGRGERSTTSRSPCSACSSPRPGSSWKQRKPSCREERGLPTWGEARSLN